MVCQFCGFPEPGYRPGADKEFICSTCVLLLVAADQPELKQAYDKALEKGCQNKATAIESFLIKEESNAREAKVSERNLVRKRTMRTVRPSRNQLKKK